MEYCYKVMSGVGQPENSGKHAICVKPEPRLGQRQEQSGTRLAPTDLTRSHFWCSTCAEHRYVLNWPYVNKTGSQPPQEEQPQQLLEFSRDISRLDSGGDQRWTKYKSPPISSQILEIPAISNWNLRHRYDVYLSTQQECRPAPDSLFHTEIQNWLPCE